VNRVELFIEPSNLASIAVADRCGYRRQELVAGHSDFGGIRRDMLRWSHDRPANSS
jgi:RimJ/RimL family protein N-acetyltransferase